MIPCCRTEALDFRYELSLDDLHRSAMHSLRVGRTDKVLHPANLVPPSCDLRPYACDLRLSACDLRHAACDLSVSACTVGLAACDLRHTACDARYHSCVRLETFRAI